MKLTVPTMLTLAHRVVIGRDHEHDLADAGLSDRVEQVIEKQPARSAAMATWAICCSGWA